MSKAIGLGAEDGTFGLGFCWGLLLGVVVRGGCWGGLLDESLVMEVICVVKGYCFWRVDRIEPYSKILLERVDIVDLRVWSSLIISSHLELEAQVGGEIGREDEAVE